MKNISILISIFLFLLRSTLVPVYGDGTHPRGITSDGTLGNAGSLNLPGPDYEIKAEYGKQAGANLFHSFRQFNIHSDESATFTGPNSIRNIITRVTGGEASWIDGIMRSAISGADMYLLNPAGIMFGPNVSLDLSGSFHIGTADYLRIGENERFYASPLKGEIFSAAAPSAFGFLDNDIAPISMEGKGEIPAEDWKGMFSTGLIVQGDSALSLIGGDIEIGKGNSTLMNGEIQPAGMIVVPEKGQINMASLGSPGEVILTDTGPDVSSFEQLGDIRISGQSALHVGGGKIFIRGGQLMLESSYINAGQVSFPGYGLIGGHDGHIDIQVRSLSASGGSAIAAQTFDQGNAGNIEIRASESISFSGSAIASTSFGEEGEDTGKAGDISVETSSLSLSEGAMISSSALSSGVGDGGNIVLSLSRLNLDNASISSASRGEEYAGDAGNIVIAESVKKSDDGRIIFQGADSVTMKNNSHISTSSWGGGHAGGLMLGAFRLDMDRSSVSSASQSEEKGGDAGGIFIVGRIEIKDKKPFIIEPADTVTMQNDSHISTSTSGEGNAGGVIFGVSRLNIDTGSVISSASLSEGKGGDAGAIFIIKGVDKNEEVPLIRYSDEIVLRNASHINTSSFGEGNAGIIALAVSRLQMDTDAFISSSGLSQEQGGEGGLISIHSDDMICMRNHAFITTSSAGRGDAGGIGVEVPRLELDSGSFISSSSLSENRGGNAGVILAGKKIVINNETGTWEMSDILREIFLNKGFEITDESVFSITQPSDTITLKNNSFISTSAADAGGGEIHIYAEKLFHFSDSSMTTSVKGGDGRGGNISIGDPAFVTLNHSRIQANAFEGTGGSIRIVADHFIRSSDSTVEASSEKGIDGVIDIASPDTNIGTGLTILPADFLDAARWLKTPCSARSGEKFSRFLLQGRDAVPLSFEDWQPSITTWPEQ